MGKCPACGSTNMTVFIKGAGKPCGWKCRDCGQKFYGESKLGRLVSVALISVALTAPSISIAEPSELMTDICIPSEEYEQYRVLIGELESELSLVKEAADKVSEGAVETMVYNDYLERHNKILKQDMEKYGRVSKLLTAVCTLLGIGLFLSIFIRGGDKK